MLIGGYASVGTSKRAAIISRLQPVAVNPESRYLISRSSLADSRLADETRFGLPVPEVLDTEEIATAEGASEASGDPLAIGDTLGVLNVGFVEYMDCMGSDGEIADAARTSYTGGKRSQKDAALLRYLMRHQHTTPFEMGTLKFRLYIPIFVYRQLFRHRTASQLEPDIADCITNDTAFQKFSVQNEMSGRYVEMPDHYYIPELAGIQKQSTDNKQGRDAASYTREEQRAIRESIVRDTAAARERYQSSLDRGVAKELGRAILPLSQYTLLVWKIDLKNLLHFVHLRIHAHAQYEVREYARALLAVVRSAFPICAEAFSDYMIDGERLTRQEIEALRDSMTKADREKVLAAFCARVSNSRERGEFAVKLGIPDSKLL